MNEHQSKKGLKKELDEFKEARPIEKIEANAPLIQGIAKERKGKKLVVVES